MAAVRNLQQLRDERIAHRLEQRARVVHVDDAHRRPAFALADARIRALFQRLLAEAKRARDRVDLWAAMASVVSAPVDRRRRRYCRLRAAGWLRALDRATRLSPHTHTGLLILIRGGHAAPRTHSAARRAAPPRRPAPGWAAAGSSACRCRAAAGTRARGCGHARGARRATPRCRPPQA
eukprot:3456567-Prymnesium_polylepis.1